MKNEPTPPVRPHYNGAAQSPASPAKAPEPRLSLEPAKLKPEYPMPAPGGLSNKALIEVNLERQRAFRKKKEERRQKRSIKKGFNRSR